MRPLKWRLEDLGGSGADASFGALVCMPEVASLTASIQSWFNARDWYHERGIPWRLGLAYEGPPGTGKTSHARAIAVELDLPVHVFDLASMSNADLREAWSTMIADTPCIALIEDIDAVFDGRENVATNGALMNSGGLTFDALLNVIDGIERHDGVLLILTTNHIDKIDPALRDRQGRIDRVVHFEPLDFARRYELALRILRDPALAEQTAIDSGAVPASRFAERCCRTALALRNGETLPAEGVYR